MAGKRRGSSSSNVQDWEKAKKVVAENAEALKTLEGHGQIFKWAEGNGINTGALFKRFQGRAAQAARHRLRRDARRGQRAAARADCGRGR
ncbi:hypothetical protein GS854_00825 [Rhodococcus hoagii]|nr:hypothetical protein [Prescottella equi]